MAVTEYATLQDLAAWLPGDLPDAAARFLRSASLLVAEACNRNPYTDAPSETDAVPLRDATCAQVTAWVLVGMDPGKAGTDYVGPVKQSKILDADISRDTTVAVKAAQAAVDGLSGEAQLILRQAGLLYVPVPSTDGTGRLPQWGQGHTLGDWSPYGDQLSGEFERSPFLWL